MQCCLSLYLFRLSEAEAALLGNILHKPKSLDDLIQELGELAPFALRLLGKIYRYVILAPRNTEVRLLSRYFSFSAKLKDAQKQVIVSDAA